MNTVNTMEGVKGVKRYKNDVKCKLTNENIEQVEEINKFFQEFKREYVNSNTKKEFFRVNNITDENIQSVIYNLKLLLDIFNWDEITIETINKVAKQHKKRAENLLKTLSRRIQDYENSRG